MTENEKYLFGFSLLDGVGPARFKKIKKNFPSLKEAWQCFDLEKFLAIGIDAKTVKMFLKQKSSLDLEKIWQKQIICENLKILDQDNPFYPLQLKELPSAPFLLFYRGNPEILNHRQLAVVGSRRATFYGHQVLEKILPPLIGAGLTITSGLAQGIDSLAAEIALKENSPTIAVLGGGLGQKILQNHPNFSLAQKILEKNGILLSEYPPFQTPNKTTFPARNRIIAGLTLGTLVIEAGEKSGSLITANYALENNREVLAVPNNIFQPLSVGANNLIKQGAKMVTGPNDVLEAFNFLPLNNLTTKSTTDIVFEDNLEKKIFENLTLEPQYLDKIAQICQNSPAEISAKISLMEIKGLVRNIGGGRFIRGIN